MREREQEGESDGRGKREWKYKGVWKVREMD